MPISSKLGFTKSKYTVKPQNAPANYDPENVAIKSADDNSSGGQSQSQGSSQGKY
jgi:hypothetical protein